MKQAKTLLRHILICGNKYVKRYITDIPFRVEVSLYWSLSINVLYALFKLITGFHYIHAGSLNASYWSSAEAALYIILSCVRFMLLRYVRKDSGDLQLGYKKYRFCGFLLLALNVVLTGVVYQVIHYDMGYRYPGFMIYAAAAYAFFCLITSMINVVKYRKLNNPALSAIKAISLAKALVAMFALQTAMFASFSTDKAFERIMNSIAGGGVCLIIFGMAVFMAARGNLAFKKIEFNNSET